MATHPRLVRNARRLAFALRSGIAPAPARPPALILVLVPVLVLALPAAGCKTETPPPAPPSAMDQVDIAMQMQGGADQLKRTSAYTASVRGTLFGSKLKATLTYKAGDLRLKTFNPEGDYQMHQVLADGHCWQQMDKVVIPCPAPLATHVAEVARMREAALLFPLKQREGLLLKASKVKEAATTLDAISIRGADGEAQGTLLLDPESSLVVGFKMQTLFQGKKGELVATFSEHKKDCGVKLPARRVYTFDGKPYMDIQVTGIICEDVDDKLFNAPKQPDHLSVDLKHTANYNLACTRLKGPLSGVPEALGKLTKHLMDHDLPPTGPAQLVYRKGPPRYKFPKLWITDVCLPVSDKAWVKPPKGTFVHGVDKGGEFFLFERIGDEFLRVFGVGGYDQTLPAMADKLMEEARSMKRKKRGDMVQILFMPPGAYPDDQQVSEIHMPIYQ